MSRAPFGNGATTAANNLTASSPRRGCSIAENSELVNGCLTQDYSQVSPTPNNHSDDGFSPGALTFLRSIHELPTPCDGATDALEPLEPHEVPNAVPLTVTAPLESEGAGSEALSERAAALGEQLRLETELFERYSFRSDKRRRIAAFHDFLIHTALYHLEQEARAPLPTVSVAYMGTLLAPLLGIGRTTLYDYLSILQSAGLIAYKGRVVTIEINGEEVNRYDGSVMCVSLSADVPAKLTRHDFEPVRDFARDIAEGRTVRALLEAEQPLNTLSTEQKIDYLLNPPFPPKPNKPSLAVRVSPGELTGDIRALADVPRDGRAEAVERVACALSHVLRDHHSLPMWRGVFWKLYGLHDGGKNPSSIGGRCLFDQAASRLNLALIAKREGVARNPGALARWHLMTWEWWEEVQRAPPRTRRSHKSTLISA